MRWWRLFRSRRDKTEQGDPPDDSGQGPRRRDATRFDLRAQIRLKVASWAAPRDFVTGDISETGLFISCDESSEVGQEVELSMRVPDAGTISLRGTVARTVASGRHGRGLGIKLEPIPDHLGSDFDSIMAAAREAAPKPADEVHDDPADIIELSEDELIEIDESSEVLLLDDLPARESGSIEALSGRPPSTPPEPRPRARRATEPALVIGIDLGTTFTSVGAIVGSKVVVLERPDDGRRSTPSVITFEDRETIIVGDRDRIATDPAHTVASPKRLLGRQFDEPDVERFVGRAPYRTLRGPDGSVLVEMWGDSYAVPQLISYLLADAKACAEEQLGQPVECAVVSVPISFEAERVEHLHRAGRMAGLEIVAVIDEPSAAALANRYSPDFGGIVGVYDFGGGTFDFSIVDVSRGDFRVLATSGDTWLGGDDFDDVLANAAANQFWRKHQVDIRNQSLDWQRLLFACEVAKRTLTTRDRAAIHLPDVLRTADGMVNLNFTIDRGVLARASAPIIDQSLATCDEALDLVGLEPGQLSAVYLSGGTTYMPPVREALAAHFGVPIRTGVPPEHAVCLGAAIHAAQMQFKREETLSARDR